MYHTGHAFRQERRRLGVPLRVLEALAGRPYAAIIGWELGGRISESDREALENLLRDIEEIKSRFRPLSLDMSDAHGLRAAIAALRAGALQPPMREEVPQFISF